MATCLNCNGELAESGKFCPHCSQKRSTGHITIKEVFRDFFTDLFDIDSKFFRSLRDLFIPGKLTRRFFEGKHKSYYPPSRFFLITILIFLATVSFVWLSSGRFLSEPEMDLYEGYFDSQMKSSLDTAFQKMMLEDSVTYDRATMDSVKVRFYDEYKPKRKDSLTMIRIVQGTVMTFDNNGIKIAYTDLMELNPDELIEKYNVKGFVNTFFFKQEVKIATDLGGAVRYAIGNGTWVLIIIVPILALFMKFLYVRRSKYFVEHLIFLFHFHAFVFIMLSLFVLSSPFIPFYIFGFLWILFAVYLFIAQKRFYRQSFFKTLLKYIMLLVFYSFAINIVAFLVVLISFALL